MVSYTHAKFGDHRHCGSGDIMVSVRHVILQDHVIHGILLVGPPYGKSYPC